MPEKQKLHYAPQLQSNKMYQQSMSQPKRARSAVVNQSGRLWSARALPQSSRVPLALGAELTQCLLVTTL